jgi:glycosyltransferase involved in cell wall biosynthesis
MKIVYLAAGAGNMYCGSCLHGNTLAAALRAAGQDCTLAPMYTPIRTDEQSVSIGHVSFSGINVYLQQHSALFRHTPWFIDRLFDRPGLLRLATGRSATVRPEHLGALAVSMLEGERGHQRKEVAKLVQWLDRDIRPDVVHINNAMLMGVVREITQRLSIPVVCSLSGEDSFLEKLLEPHRSRARDVLRQRAADAAALVAMNRYYAHRMAEYLSVPPQQIRVIPPGLNLAGHGTRHSGPRPFTIGYLARVCPDKGLHQLAAALQLLAADPGLPPVRVQAAGYLDAADRPYLADIQGQLAQRGVADRFQYLGELDRAAKIAFLQSLDLFCLPTVYRESKGLSVLEAWANAVPAVLPAHGAFPEMVEDIGGGLLCAPNDPRALAAALRKMILDPDFLAQCGRKAQQAVHQRYNAEVMAGHVLRLYEEVRGRGLRIQD